MCQPDNLKKQVEVMDIEVKEERDSGQAKAKSTNIEAKSTNILSLYDELLEQHPVYTKSLTAAVVQGIGAMIASVLLYHSQPPGNVQNNTHKRKNIIDWPNVMAFALHGGLVQGPVSHYWFEVLSKYGPNSKFQAMLIDQLMVRPPLLVGMFVFLDCARAAFANFQPSLRRHIRTAGPAVLSSWTFWPLAVLLTFRYMKRKHYTVALNLCSLAWTIYLGKRQSAANTLQ